MRGLGSWGWLVALALALLACAPQPAPFPVAATPAERQPTPEVESSLTPTPSIVSSPTLSPEVARPTVSVNLQTLNAPVVGGLQAPEQVAWYSLSSPDTLSYLLGSQLHRSLLDPLTAGPSLAQGWTMRGSRATFTLSPDAAWSDGSPLRAADVADLLLQAADEGELYGLESARAVDARMVEIEVEGPLCSALMRVATWPMVDVREWPPARTSGPVSVEEAGAMEWALEPAQFSYRVYPDEHSLREAWEQGDINSIVGASDLTMGPLPGEQATAQRSGPLLATLLFRMDDGIVGNAVMREALTLATDRAALFEAAYGFAPDALLTALLPPGHWAAPTNSLDFDPEEAARLLDAAGWRDRDGDGIRENEAGDPLSLTLSLPLSQDMRWEMLARVLAEQWADLGVELVPMYLESYPLQERLHDGRWQVALVAYHLAPDADQLALWGTPASSDLLGNEMNVTGYRSTSVTSLLREAAETPGCDLEERAALYHRAWGQLLNDRPLWPLFPLPLDEVHRPGVSWPNEGS